MNKKSIAIYPIILFIIWPFFSLIHSLIYYKNNSYKYIIPLFTSFIGFSFQRVYFSDSDRMILFFNRFNHITINDLLQYLTNRFYGIEIGGVELFIVLIAYFTKQVTYSHKIFFLLQGLILGVFIVLFLIQIYSLYDKYKFNNVVVKIFAISLMINILPCWAINGRYWIAYWLFMFAIFMYIKTNNIKYLLSALFPIFIHQGYIFAFIIICIYTLTNNKIYTYKLYYIIFILTFIYSQLGLQYFKQIGELLSGEYSEKFLSYSSQYESNLHNISSNSFISIFLSYQNIVIYYSLISSITWLRFIHKFKFDNKSETLYLIILLFLSFCNFSSSIPSICGRYQIISSGLMLLLLYMLSLNNKMQILSFPVIISVIGILYNFIINFRMETDYLYGFIFGINALTNYYLYPDISFWTIIQYVY